MDERGSSFVLFLPSLSESLAQPQRHLKAEMNFRTPNDAKMGGLPFGQITPAELVMCSTYPILAEKVFWKTLLIALVCSTGLPAQEPVFSGPQIKEPLVPFQVRSLTEPDVGKQVDYVTNAKGKPLLLVFVHDVNRQSISMVRLLTAYSTKRLGDGLHTGVVMLHEDANEAEKNFQRMKHALNAETPTGVSLEGREGPGSYGLNRLVTLTILIARDDKVTANYALVQPSLQVDLLKIVKSITEVVGGTVPTMDELIGKEAMRAMQGDKKGDAAAPDVSGLVRPLIQKKATEDEVTQIAEKIEKTMKADEAVRREIYRIATTISGSGKLTDYGTAKAQEYLTKWAKENKDRSDSTPTPTPTPDKDPKK